MPIYTKTGDDGTTALFGGKRVLKCDELVDVYGSIDELNSWIGLICSELKDKTIKTFLLTVQSDLFTLGSTLAGWKGDLTEVVSRVEKMETLIDRLDKQLPELTNFILPGGSDIASKLHIARSICRRVERQTVKLNPKQSMVIRYLNRLSDALFVIARYMNMKNTFPEHIWSGIGKTGKT